ncbi:MAG: 4-hydroxy-3-methylbut-2-enyl diphosphate reductase [Desulfuromonas sp.]|nr:MAG: 4-hydroxy-3-methylbut-2-enyl diphosphate reductase [Desulfuromonas sp.]
MKIILAQKAGFCFGVKRATQLAFEAADLHEKICSLGPIIHSPQLVARLAEKGVEVIDEVEDIDNGAVIVRSHGVTAGELAAIGERHLDIVDTTCPFVKKAQEYAALLAQEGYVVVLVGEKEHPEVRSIVSYAAGSEVFVVANRAQAEKLPNRSRLGVVAQTTQSFDNLHEVVEVCLQKGSETRVFNTICNATVVRQNEARAIAREVDLMLVIGGFNSANTGRLAQICMEIQPRTHHVETAAQIEKSWFSGVSSVGITAGASTPRWVIEEIIGCVESIGQRG